MDFPKFRDIFHVDKGSSSYMLDVYVKGDMVNRFYFVLRDKRAINQNCSTYIIDFKHYISRKGRNCVATEFKDAAGETGGNYLNTWRNGYLVFVCWDCQYLSCLRFGINRCVQYYN